MFVVAIVILFVTARSLRLLHEERFGVSFIADMLCLSVLVQIKNHVEVSVHRRMLRRFHYTHLHVSCVRRVLVAAQ